MSGQRKPVLTGGCQYGAMRYTLYADPEQAGLCHCRICQKAVGGPFKAWANVRMTNFAWTRGAPSVFRSSSAAERGFCAQCGTPLYFNYLRRTDSISVTVGSLDTPGAVRLSRADGTESRLANFAPDVLAALPTSATADTGGAKDLSCAVSYQHPDHDTPPDWHPPT